MYCQHCYQRFCQTVLVRSSVSKRSNTMFPIQGSCNCGCVIYHVTAPFKAQVACHCKGCQKHSQSAFSIIGILNSHHFLIDTTKLYCWRKRGAKGEVANCYFCSGCGNRIYHQLENSRDYVLLKLGTLDDTSVINPRTHIWTCTKQDWFAIPSEAQQFKESPFF